jgi:two-component system sensor histidine kinase UhpB
MASDIHEGVSQELATVSVQLEVLSQLLSDSPQVQELAGLTRATTRRAIVSIREAILDLARPFPRDAALSTGMREFVEEFARRWAVDVSFDAGGDPSVIEPDVLALVYAFVQETLTNLRKYSASPMGAVHLEFDEHVMTVTVRSEGEAIVNGSAGESTGQGLQLMAGRARLLGGDVRSITQPNGGREVVLEVPN